MNFIFLTLRKQLDWNSATSQLEALEYPDQSLKIRQVLKRKDLEPLQLALDRFCFENKTCRSRPNIGLCSSPEGLNPTVRPRLNPTP